MSSCSLHHSMTNTLLHTLFVAAHTTHCLYTTTSTPLPLHHYLYTTTSTYTWLYTSTFALPPPHIPVLHLQLILVCYFFTLCTVLFHICMAQSTPLHMLKAKYFLALRNILYSIFWMLNYARVFHYNRVSYNID